MKVEEFQKMYDLEMDHWWYKGKRDIINTVINSFKDNSDKSSKNKILDVGCGTGAVMRFLERYGEVYGMDVSFEAVNFCKKRNIKNVEQGDALNLPYPDNTFNYVTCLDVLYHKTISDDVAVIKELNRVLKPGGKLIITDSACPSLWSKHDRAVHARERYTKKILKERVKKGGFEVKKISYFNFFLFPIVYFVRRLENIFESKKEIKSNVSKTPYLINQTLYSILKLESFILKNHDLPIGVSLICVAQKIK